MIQETGVDDSGEGGFASKQQATKEFISRTWTDPNGVFLVEYAPTPQGYRALNVVVAEVVMGYRWWHNGVRAMLEAPGSWVEYAQDSVLPGLPKYVLGKPEGLRSYDDSGVPPFATSYDAVKMVRDRIEQLNNVAAFINCLCSSVSGTFDVPFAWHVLVATPLEQCVAALRACGVRVVEATV